MDVREASVAYDVLAAAEADAVPVGYKRMEVGIIPEDWRVVKLPDISWFQEGPGVRNYQFTTSGVKLFNGTNIENGRINLDTTGRYISEEEAYGWYRHFLADAGDIVIACSGVSIEKFDEKVGVLSLKDLPLCMNTSTMRFKVKSEQICKEYFRHFLKSKVFKSQVSGIATGSAQLNFGPAHVSAIDVPLPAHAEQNVIAAALSDADTLIESLEQLLAKKRQIKHGTMQELLTGKKRLPGFKGVWQTKTLGDIFTISGGFSASRAQLSSEGHCYLHYGDIHTSDKTFIDVRAEFQDIPKLHVSLKCIAPGALLDDGDVVFVDASEDDEGASKHVVVANPDRTPFISGLHTIVAKAKSAELDHLYLRYCFQTRAVKSQFRFFAVGTKVSGISKSNIVKVTIPIPTRTEQSAIAAILSDMDAEIAALETHHAKARALKQGMMQELLTGRIRLLPPESEC